MHHTVLATKLLVKYLKLNLIICDQIHISQRDKYMDYVNMLLIICNMAKTSKYTACVQFNNEAQKFARFYNNARSRYSNRAIILIEHSFNNYALHVCGKYSMRVCVKRLIQHS